MRVLWLLVGRGGSKGVPGKNLARVGGRTLVEWKLGGAIAAGATEVVVSSDSPEIRGVAMHHGTAAGLHMREIVRPAELASDTATTAEVVRHALEHERGAGREYEAVMLLEAASPFTRAEQYRQALTMMAVKDADLVVGMRESAPHPAFVGDVRDDCSVNHIVLQFQRMARRRQDFTPQHTMSGSLYLFKTAPFLATGDIYAGPRCFGLTVDRWSGHEIDTPDDLALAEWAWQTGRVG